MEVEKRIARQISESVYPLSERSQKKISSLLQATALKKGELLLREGDVCKQISYVHQGLLRMFYYKNGKELTEDFAYEQQTICSVESCFRQVPSRFVIEALEPTLVYGIPFETFIALSREENEVADFYRFLLEKALIESQQRIDLLRFETAAARYHRLMKDNPEIIKRAPLSSIASYLLMTPETLSRVRGHIL